MEEERRLFYVAITRAEEHCFLSFAKCRFRYGKTEFSNPSRFLKDIDKNFLSLPQDSALKHRVDESASRFRREIQGGATYKERERPQTQIIAPTLTRNLKPVTPAASVSTSANGPVASVEMGQTIEHERFGLGQVTKVEGVGDNAKATISFENAGEKQLLLRFARFKVVK